MADEERRTTTRTTSASASDTAVETVRGRRIPSTLWLMVGTVLAVAVILCLFNGGLTRGGADGPIDVTIGGAGSEAAEDANAVVDGTADALAAADGTDAEVAPAEPPAAGN